MKREYGIDALRLLAMFAVVVIHNLSQGGVLASATGASAIAFWTVEMVGIVAVNVFAMISGYVSNVRPSNLKKLLPLYKTVYFYTVLIAIVLYVLVGEGVLSGTPLWTLLAPFLAKDYWYFNAFVVLMLLQPFLAAGLDKLSKSQLQQILVVLLLASATAGVLNSLFLVSGYSAIWLITMYITGAYVKLYGESFDCIKTYQLVIVIVACVIYGVAAYLKLSLGHGFNADWFVSYISPNVIVQSIAVLLVFKRLNVKSIRVQKWLVRLTPLAFSVYLIDTHPLFFKNVLKDSFVWILDYPTLFGVFAVLVISFAMFVAFIVIDAIRYSLFDRLGGRFNEK